MTVIPKYTEQGSRAFAGALAFVGIVCIAYPFADLLLNNWPIQVGDIAWRFQFVGMMSQLLITPLIGVAFLAGAGILNQGGPFLKLGGFVSLVTGLLVLLLTVSFILDGLQLRNLVAADEIPIFQMSMIRALLKNLITGVGFIYVGYGAIKAGSEMRRKRSTPHDPKSANQPAIVMKSDPQPGPAKQG